MSRSTLDVYVHIGAPKSGTTFVQQALWSQREALAADGVLYPYCRPTEHFEAMLDLRGHGWGGIQPENVAGTWDRVAERVRGWDGHTAILTNELLGRADRQRISRLVASLAPARVHVVYTARDLARQLVSSWQEQIKHNLAVTFEEFLAEMLEHGPGTHPRFARQFWPLQDVDHVLARWSKLVGHDRVCVVTVPPAGERTDQLWARFCDAVGLDGDRYPAEISARNISLSVAEAEFFRRVNEGVADLAPREYADLVRAGLMHKVADGQGRRPVLPERHRDRVRQRSLDLVAALRRSRYRVVGDLDELVPDPFGQPVGPPTCGSVTDDQMMPMAMSSIHLLLHTAAEQRARIDDLTNTPTTTASRPAGAWTALRRRAGSLRRTANAALARLPRGGLRLCSSTPIRCSATPARRRRRPTG